MLECGIYYYIHRFCKVKRERKIHMTNSKLQISTTNKIHVFLDEFKKNPSRSVDSLCRPLSLPKSQLYKWLRNNNMSLANIRNDTKMSNNKTEEEEEKKMELETTKLSIQEMLTRIDAIRKQGFNVEGAIKKAGIKLSPSTYYSYKTKETAAKKPVAKKPGSLALIKPTVQTKPPHIPHHVIEYVEKAPRIKRPELLMMLGSPEALLEFVKRLQEN